ncbi:flavodoxin family protein [Saccharothrix syringae]|uniref:Flavodoxin n=1 Tax=Saccharothrix syringae TaxID=103733 RepID=A0A5Q0H9A8_SACSY|nr:NAD(P)H-dependent oxidoreductase [Saccharothrix syringae]QFZ22779.1 flavodoxin [Saccharothrix syringae]
MSERKFLFVLGSARRDGNTERLARLAAEQLGDDVEQRWLWLGDVPQEPFRDLRYPEEVERHPRGTEKLLLDATLEATDIVIASPTYWYSVSSSTKRYLDNWSNWERVPGFMDAMATKRLWAITALADEPEQAAALLDMLRRGARYLKMTWSGALVGVGNRPGDVLNDTTALAEAKTFFTP